MILKQSRIIDGDHSSENQLCGHSLFGSDTGVCPDCHKRKALMASGYCATCAMRRGIDVFNTRPHPRPRTDNNQQD